jgi:hypothetical protein
LARTSNTSAQTLHTMRRTTPTQRRQFASVGKPYCTRPGVLQIGPTPFRT